MSNEPPKADRPAGPDRPTGPDRPAGADAAGRGARPRSIAELRAIAQPPEVRSRANAEHWTASLYLRDLSPYLTWVLVKTCVSANGVTGLMIVVGWSTAAALLIPGIWGALIALILGQLQMLVDCCDGEVARWRGTSSPAGVFLDKVGHYSTEALIPLMLGVRAAAYPLLVPEDYLWTTLGTLLALIIVLNKALNDMVHVARANAGLAKLADTRSASAPTNGLVAKLRTVARFVPFHRLYHSVELTILAFVTAVAGLFVGQELASRVLVAVLVPLALLSLIGHFVAIMASNRVRL
ncbi:MAG: CDP-alcohol phosphatidyltransferase family protein [Microbacteriaceae bacterium]|nr:MAG: CDP-alcohol phosphatidyltransferase family protein [Microbacteriaceae bacterium]